MIPVTAALPSLSPWAARRSANAGRDPDSIFNRVFFRSPAQLLAATFDRSEREGEGRETGAFVAARWEKG